MLCTLEWGDQVTKVIKKAASSSGFWWGLTATVIDVAIVAAVCDGDKEIENLVKEGFTFLAKWTEDHLDFVENL